MSDNAFPPESGSNHDHLIVFTRYPEPGKTKTRLIPALGPDGAAMVQQKMTEWTLKQAHLWQQQRPPQQIPGLAQPQRSTSVDIRFAGGSHEQMQQWLGTGWTYLDQGDGNLGVRLIRAFQSAFDQGATAVVAVGIDCPGITEHVLSQAYQQLQQYDTVIGPADDGGYYLIGLRHLIPELFQQINWGTETVRQQTLAIAANKGVVVAQLGLLPDVDRPEDLLVWQQCDPDKKVPTSGQTSVIIPVLNEAGYIQQTLQTLYQAADQPDNLEIIVVDGGSHDDTVMLAKTALTEIALTGNIDATNTSSNNPVKVIASTSGRANQMNAGAAIATGEYLLFLHADTQTPIDFQSYVAQTLHQPNVVAGAFELAIQGSQRGFRLIEWGIKWRSQLFQMPYGDQAIFTKAETFQELGGFPKLPLMEDFEFIRRLKRKGKVAIAPTAVTTSGRRWQKLGLLQTTLINQTVIWGYLMGISPQKLIQIYQKKKN
ncbi:MAG: DUF2064 domain-containing protein [Symploca sp. SIO2B6]|nr:DUF2064 domain-containing protein [Symploca sp. SIO2B6]